MLRIKVKLTSINYSDPVEDSLHEMIYGKNVRPSREHCFGCNTKMTKDKLEDAYVEETFCFMCESCR